MARRAHVRTGADEDAPPAQLLPRRAAAAQTVIQLPDKQSGSSEGQGRQ